MYKPILKAIALMVIFAQPSLAQFTGLSGPQGGFPAASGGAAAIGTQVFGGDGSDGSVTGTSLTTKPQTNATVVTVTGLPGYVRGSLTINSQTTVTIGGSGTLGLTGGGYSGGLSNTATVPATNGGGPCPGYASVGVFSNGGGGGGSGAPGTNTGGNGGGLTAATLLAPGGASAGGPTTTALLSTGSGGGGGGGQGATTSNGAGGAGGQKIIICAGGDITIQAASGVIDCSGAAGTAAGVATGSGGGGGGGGAEGLFSLTRVNNLNFLKVQGGAGGNGGGTSGGGGGGGLGGTIIAISPNTSLGGGATATGGAAGTTTTGTNAGAGGSGILISTNATPNQPLVSMLQTNDAKRFLAYARPRRDKNCYVDISIHELCYHIANTMDQYIATVGDNYKYTAHNSVRKEVKDTDRIRAFISDYTRTNINSNS